MKQIFITQKGRKSLHTASPTPGEKELLVAVQTSVISTGTETMDMKKKGMTLSEQISEKKVLWDKVNKLIKEKGYSSALKAVKSKLGPAEQDVILKPVGYSNAGVVISKGRLVKNFNVGDRVACAGAGIAAHAEYITVPVNLAVKVPNQVSMESAGFTTIGAIAMQGIRRANVTFGETVVITGLGLIGLLAVQIAKAWGLVVIGLDLNIKKLELARELGADYCLDASDHNLEQKIYDITNGHGADAVIIYAATKNSEPANQAFEICRKKGRVVVVGSVGMDLKRDSMYVKELDFVISTSYGPGRYDNLYEVHGIDYPIGYVRWTENRNMSEFVRLLSVGKVKVEQLVSNRFTIDQAAEAYQFLIDNPGENIACIFKYEPDEERIPISKMEVVVRKLNKSKIGVGIIGAGGFIQRNHLPNILGLPERFELISIAEKTTASAKMAGEKYSIFYVSTDYKQLLADPEIDLIVIGTRHNNHAALVIDAIKSGKHVLVEKPLAMTHEELSMIEKAISENQGLIVTVGFNRRYSPLIQRAKQTIIRNCTPIVINYRVNAGYFPPDLWIQDLEEGGGRIVGEVCHFIDLITYLSSSSLKEVSAVHIPPDAKAIKSEDNVIVTLSFENGSIGVLTYTSLGGPKMEKERIEIFSNGSSMVINDFVELLTFNCEEKGLMLKQPDKGHKTLISELAKALNNEESLILPFETDIEMTRLTLSIVDQIHTQNLSNV